MKDFEFHVEDGKVLCKFTPLAQKDRKIFELQCPFAEGWPVKFYTATTDMRDFIANVVEITNQGTRCAVKGVYRGEEVMLRNVLIRDAGIRKIGQRVMVSEHINVSGAFDLIATIKRILPIQESGLNFINVGWSNKVESRILRIDAYTGEVKELTGGVIRR